MAEPVLVRRQIGAEGPAAARLSLAFLADGAMDAELPTTRPRAPVQGCRDLSAADMVRNARTGKVRVDPRTHDVTLDGEPVSAPPLEQVAFSGRFLLG
jgi:urease subunit alpha